ncbi:unnamed protein product [Agarophyton chilense]|eukprot:gb/GEZJ01003114.1/.p1 GENE.gb/GEZJ01003114.1/~~gb/GEZJ01003114.1/.p1  ORF type:complete len:674 (-),score=57.60 gb/GEZJ01003114.1/:904-2925(-)
MGPQTKVRDSPSDRKFISSASVDSRKGAYPTFALAKSRKQSAKKRGFPSRLSRRLLRIPNNVLFLLYRALLSRKSCLSSPLIAAALGVCISLSLTLITAALYVIFSIPSTELPSKQISHFNSRISDEAQHAYVAKALANNFDIPPSLTDKLPPKQRFKLLANLQYAQSTKKRPPRRLFFLHVVGNVSASRLNALATAISYAKNTNRYLLILWDVERGGEELGTAPLSALPTLGEQYMMLVYVNSLRLTPSTSDWSEFQINYYTSFGSGGYPLDNVAALANRHIFYRAHKQVEGRYATASQGIVVMEKMFQPDQKFQSQWNEFFKEWTFPGLTTADVRNVLNRVYGVPQIFIDSMSDSSQRKLLRQLDRSISKRAFFIHAQYGLGNRLRALGSAMAISKVTGRVLVLIWEPDVHLNCRFSDLFANDMLILEKLNMNWPPGDVNTKDHAMRTVDFYNFMRFNGKHIHNPLTELVNPRPGRHVYAKTAYVVRSSFTPRILSTTSKYWKLMRESLVPNAEIMNLVSDPSFINIKGMVGVHIRSRTIENDIKGVSEEFYGNGSTVTDHWRRITGLKTFENKIMRLSLRYRFFVAADTREAINELERKFGSHRIFSIPRDQDCITRDVECAKLALADILLLSKVPTLLGSHWSSFTEGAVRLSGKMKVLMAGVHFGRPK